MFLQGRVGVELTFRALALRQSRLIRERSLFMARVGAEEKMVG